MTGKSVLDVINKIDLMHRDLQRQINVLSEQLQLHRDGRRQAELDEISTLMAEGVLSGDKGRRKAIKKYLSQEANRRGALERRR